jgi:hypothetical protein
MLRFVTAYTVMRLDLRFNSGMGCLMVLITPETLIGRGLHREVYLHPEDHLRCIKVVVNGGSQETDREQSYYQLLQKRQIAWRSVPKFYGNIETNMGQGAVFELIRDESGEVSKTLQTYFQDPVLFEQEASQLVQCLKQFKADLLQQNIITMTIYPKNMLYQKAEKNRILLVDNIGNSDLIPIASYFPWIGNKKIERKWRRFKTLLLNKFPLTHAILEEI